MNCEHCGTELVGRRQGARFCDSTCRARKSEQALRSARKPLTQRDRILFELREAGERGVHSEVFYRLHMPRFAARILELKEAGHNITSVPEGNGARYRLHPAPDGEGVLGTRGPDQARGMKGGGAHVKRDAFPSHYTLVGSSAAGGHVCAGPGGKERHAGGRAEPSPSSTGAGNATPGVASPELSLFEEAPQQKRPSMFDVDVEAA